MSSRIPRSCPVGFESRYTVQPGDTMFFIAQTFDTTLGALTRANPHISNPNLIFPGDVLCVPGAPPAVLPCCVTLVPPTGSRTAGSGIALASMPAANTRAVSIAAINLPRPQAFGDFDMYEGFVGIPFVGGFGFGLNPVVSDYDDTATWCGGVEAPVLPGFPAFPSDTLVVVRAANSQTAVSADVSALEGTLTKCR